MKVTILDGYIDEPSRLGVPPFVSPYSRYAWGAVMAAGHDPSYMTIDHIRRGFAPTGDLLFIISGPIVPGKYLRTMPMSDRELSSIIEEARPEAHVWHSSKPEKTPPGATHVWDCDPDAYIHDILAGSASKRRRTPEEWSEWAVLGADVFRQHHDAPASLIADIDFSYGCPHYISGGCSFCTEPLFGKPVFRSQQAIAGEIEALLKQGCVNFRLGGGSCIFSYMAEDVANTECPKPNVPALRQLFNSIAKLPGINVLHTDNADPGILANHPNESAEILKMITRACTSGNVLSLGLESADPAVAEQNNLNSTPEQAMEAIRMINKAGKEPGPTGLPKLLPGLNLISGLDGETRETFNINIQFLKEVLSNDLLLRRINIRQVAPARRDYKPTRLKKEFIRFKESVRREIDTPMLRAVAPAGTVLKGIYTEVQIGKLMFGRQLGTYPILMGIPDKVPQGHFIDVKVTGHGSRSLTGLPYPLDINNCSLAALEELPGIGRKRASRIFMNRPILSEEELAKALDDAELARNIIPFLG